MPGVFPATRIGFLILAALWAQSPQTSVRESAIDEVFAAYAKPGAPGCVVGVIRESRLVFSRGYGLANIEHDVPLTPKTVLDIGSTSKQFTAASILLLEQQGRLSVDDDVRKFIPELPPYRQTITLRHLLNHTSGIRDYLTLMSVAGVNFDGVTGDEEALRIITRQKALNFPPGSEHLYSNSGYFLLSVIVKRASGKSLRRFAQEEIFGPLEMRDTHFHDDHTMIVPRRATAYAPGPQGTFAIEMSGFEQTGDGAVYTTIEDLARWDRNFYEPKVGGRALVEGLLRSGVLSTGKAIPYAFGLINGTHKGLPVVSHGGSWAGYRAELIRFPKQQFSVICLCNRADGNPSAKARQVADLYLAPDIAAARPDPELPARAEKPVTLTAEQLARHAGIYRNLTTGALWHIQIAGGRLRVGGQFLAPVAPDRFAVEGAGVETTLTFSPTSTGQRVTLSRDGSEIETLEQLHPPELTPPALARLAGSYYSEELDMTARLTAENGQLFYSGPNERPRQLAPVASDTFMNGAWQFELTRDAAGAVDGFLLHAGRIRGLRFARR
jgi:CubicO group peptidase (beta-lactamase class C family)